MKAIRCLECAYEIRATNSPDIYRDALRHNRRTGHRRFRGIRGMGPGFTLR